MDVRNRMADVVKLRCNACQDFLKMTIAKDWQSVVYDKAMSEYKNNTRLKDKFIPAYEKMRDVGIENYTIDDMDVTFISAVIHYCPTIVSTDKRTRKSLERLTDDRNITNHSNENEEPEELYLRGLLALCNLKDFIRTVDKYEFSIPDEIRKEYRARYSARISELQDLLDEERICLIQDRKKMERDIQRILDCDNEKSREKLWMDTYKLYFDRYWNIEGERERYNEFIIASSDAGVPEAHSYAILVFSILYKDYDEVESRLKKHYQAHLHDMYPYAAKTVIDTINELLSHGRNMTPELDEMVNMIISLGYPVKREESYFRWESKTKNNK